MLAVAFKRRVKFISIGTNLFVAFIATTFLKRRSLRACVGIVSLGALGLCVMSPLLFVDGSRSTRESFVSLSHLAEETATETPCPFGQIENLFARTCVWPKLPHTDRVKRAALDDAAEARLRRVVTLIDDGRFKDGVGLLTPLVHQGHPRAQFITSELYRRGEVLPKNVELSMELLRVAASQGDASSQFALASRLTEDCERECPEIIEAISLYKAASEAGYDKATEALAEIYYVGIGVEEDENKALPFIIKAAEAGLSASQRVLAHLYNQGTVIQSSPELALKWNEKAAENDDFRAMARAGLMYLRGEGTDKDFTKGIAYLWIAANAGDAPAACFLGSGMLNDWFNVSDRLSGLMWLKLAAKTDTNCAKKLLREHYLPLSPAEDALTDQMVELCLSRHECGSKPWEWKSLQG